MCIDTFAPFATRDKTPKQCFCQYKLTNNSQPYAKQMCRCCVRMYFLFCVCAFFALTQTPNEAQAATMFWVLCVGINLLRT